jgi:3-phenylpropionate/cinnamic acid dioxygenase small subunit
MSLVLAGLLPPSPSQRSISNRRILRNRLETVEVTANY